MPANPPTPRAKLARARALFIDEMPKRSSDAPPICTTQDALTPNPVAVIPCRTRAQAARIAKVANMTEGERVELAGSALYADANWSSTWAETTPQVRRAYIIQARAILSALGLATGGKA